MGTFEKLIDVNWWQDPHNEMIQISQILLKIKLDLLDEIGKLEHQTIIITVRTSLLNRFKLNR